MVKIKIQSEYIKLDSFLKLAEVCQTGGEAKIRISEGEFAVNGETELRRGRKLRPGDIVSAEGTEFEVVS